MRSVVGAHACGFANPDPEGDMNLVHGLPETGSASTPPRRGHELEPRAARMAVCRS